jgi:glutamate racemase
MSDQRPVGVLDSGLGGITVVREITRLMPQERIVYLGDTARGPYGCKSDELTRKCSLECAGFLLSQDIKMLVIASNTVTAVALELIRDLCRDIPVIGTIRSGAYTNAIYILEPGMKVFSKECSLLIPVAEEGTGNSDIARAIAQYYLYELVDSGIDCLILGCSHYPLLLEVFQDVVSSRIELIDCALWTAVEMQGMLEVLDARFAGDAGGLAQNYFYVTDPAPVVRKNAGLFSGGLIKELKTVSIDQLTK